MKLKVGDLVLSHDQEQPTLGIVSEMTPMNGFTKHLVEWVDEVCTMETEFTITKYRRNFLRFKKENI